MDKYLKQKRIEANLSQLQLATQLGYTSPQFVSNWERGVALPPLKICKELARLLKVSRKEMRHELIKNYTAKVHKAL